MFFNKGIENYELLLDASELLLKDVMAGETGARATVENLPPEAQKIISNFNSVLDAINK